MSILDRFCLPDKRLLIETLCRQTIVNGNRTIADALADIATLEQFEAGAELIRQNDTDNDILFLLSGSVGISINGRVIGERHAGQHVGEMALIDPSAPRSATVSSITDIAVARVKENDFSQIAAAHPNLWRMLAIELGDRLRQRSRFIRTPNLRSHLFIGSSREALEIAEQIKNDLSAEPISTHLWTDDIFAASSTSIESLERELAVADFAALVLSPDDVTHSRGMTTDSPRDNVIFELGLFMGSISRSRTYLIKPSGTTIKIPTDLLGAKPINYSFDPAIPLASRISPVVNELRKLIASKGPR